MIRKLIVPNGWPCTLKAAPPGPFVTLENPELLCFKSEYTHATAADPHNPNPMAYNSGGEFFCGDVTLIQPVEMIVQDD